MCTIVYKLGGSLLALPDLRFRLQALLKQPFPFAGPTNEAAGLKQLVVVGGGQAADEVREWDRDHSLGDELAHRLALQAMSFNAQFVAGILGEARLVTTRAEAGDAWDKGRVAVLAAAEFVDAEERNTHDQLPRSWDVTSDSVAAYVALHWPADALALLKSVPLPTDADLEMAVTRGFLDPYFPRLSGRIPQIAWADLRSPEPRLERWLESAG